MSRRSGGKGQKVVISGYYGYNNCGDEAVLLSMINAMKKLRPDARIIVLSRNPSMTRVSYGVEAVNRWNPASIVLQLLSCRLLISGGGSLLQDVTSSKSLRYYLAVIRLAIFFRKSVMIYCQGIGPLNIAKNRAKVAKTLNRCQTITVRDGHSADLLREIGVKQDIQVTCDPVMALSNDVIDDVDLLALISKATIAGAASGIGVAGKPILLAVIRCWRDNRHIAHIARFFDNLIKKGWNVLLAAAHYPGDTEAFNMITGLMKERPYLLDMCLSAREFMALTSGVDAVFSMRLHGLICAYAMRTPMIGLSYDPKVDAFMEQAGLGEFCFQFDSFDSDAAESLLPELSANPPQAEQQMDIKRREMREKALETAIIAARLL